MPEPLKDSLPAIEQLEMELQTAAAEIEEQDLSQKITSFEGVSEGAISPSPERTAGLCQLRL